MDGKTWTVVGVSTKNGETKMRFANGKAEARKRVLENDGHSRIDLRDLPSPMTREAAERWWQEQGGQAVLSLVGPRAPRACEEVAPVEPAPVEDDGTPPWLPPGTPKGQTHYDAPLPPAHMVKGFGPAYRGPSIHPRSYWPWKEG